MSVCFFALSGRCAERVLLDAAATVVPLVAIVPTMISPGSVPGIDAHCPPGRGSCVPAAFDAAVHGGVLTDLIVGAVFVLVAVGLALAGQVDRPGTALSLAIAGVVLATVGLTWWLARDAFPRWAHLSAAVAFFAIIAAVVVIGMPLYGSLHVGHLFGMFVGEVLALVLFAAFWVLQSVQYWRVDDPAIRAQV